LNELAALRAEINTQAAKISKLEFDLQMANSRVDELETYTRRDNLIISGLPVESYAEASGSTDQEGRGESSAVLSNWPGGPGPRAPSLRGPPNSRCVNLFIS